MFGTGGSITSRGKEKGRDLHGPWSTRNERVGVRRGDADAEPVMASFRWPLKDGASWWFMMVYACLCLFGHVTPFFLIRGWPENRQAYRIGHRASQNRVVATSTMQDFADQGSVLLLGRDEKNVFFRGGRNPRWNIDYQGRTYSVWLLMNKIHKFPWYSRRILSIFYHSIMGLYVVPLVSLWWILCLKNVNPIDL